MKNVLRLITLKLGILLLLSPLLALGQTLVINEVVSSNGNSAEDEDGDSPDWIELYNAGSSAVDLAGYGLSDDDDPFKWTFASGSLAASQHLIVFASDKDRQSSSQNWESIITAGDEWRYFVGVSEPLNTWNTNAFNDDIWETGPTGIGYGDNDDATVIANTLSLYMRKSFDIADLAAVQDILFHIDVDDGYIAYLNGEEFARQNMGAPGTYASHEATTDDYTEPLLPQNIDLSPVFVDLSLLQAGNNVLAIQVHNSGTNSSDMTALPFLTVGQSAPATSTPPDYLILPGERQFHTNFKISSTGERLQLTTPSGVVMDTVEVPELSADLAYGRESDGADTFHYFSQPTPGEANVGGFVHLAFPAVPTTTPGFYSAAIAIEIEPQDEGTFYRYTTDGSKPNNSSSLYSPPIMLSSSTILRVRSTTSDGLHHAFASFSYFINQLHDMPVISLIAEHDDFFDNDSGIYVMGDNAEGNFPHFGSNFWEDWERPIHIEYFEDAQELSYSAPGGVKIFGGWSRGNAQRSLSLFARGRYGASEFKYPFFSEREYDEFQSLVLRNSGNDWQQSGYRDVFMTSLVADLDIERQAAVPVEVYLNGDYWGIYNLREKTNEHMVASQAGIDKDDLDLLEINGTPVHGISDQYWELINYVNDHTLSSDTDFEYIRERVDIDNFIEYYFAQIYFDNQDWPGNNIKYWKSREPGGRWRWVLYDTDFGFGIWGPSNFTRNTLAFATDPNGPGWPNPPWSTLLLRKFLNNAAFKREFILKGSDLLNSNFLSDRVTAKLSTAKNAILLGVEDHFSRWNHNNMNNWNSEYAVMNNFGQERPAYMRNHMRSKFGLPQEQPLTVQVEPEGAGLIRVHSLTPSELPWTGQYFANVPLDVEAIAAAGYSFSHWENITTTEPELLLNMASPRTLTAVFVENPGDLAGIVINEINYNSADDSDSKDWLELYNSSEVAASLNGWSLRDSNEDNQFYLDGVTVEADGYLVLCHDTLAFRSVYGDTAIIIGDMDFNFNNGGEHLSLYDPLGSLVDSLSYDDEPPWPSQPDGSGATLELIHPDLDNGSSENWGASEGLGTPGGRNSRYTVPVAVEETQLPEELQLHAAFPNPFNASIAIPISLGSSEPFDIQVFDLRGALIRNELIAGVSSNRYTYFWDGRTNAGVESASGMYVIRVTQNQLSNSIKVALLR